MESYMAFFSLPGIKYTILLWFKNALGILAARCMLCNVWQISLCISAIIKEGTYGAERISQNQHVADPLLFESGGERQFYQCGEAVVYDPVDA